MTPRAGSRGLGQPAPDSPSRTDCFRPDGKQQAFLQHNGKIMTVAPQPSGFRSRLSASPMLFAMLPPLFWAGNFFLAKALRDDFPPFQMSFWRWMIAFLVLLPFAAPRLRASMGQLSKEWPWLAALGVVGVTAFNCFIYVALHYAMVVNAALINALMPVMTLLFAYFILGARIAGLQIAGIAAAMVGATVIITRGDVLTLSAFVPSYGDILVFLGMSTWALYTVLIRWKPSTLDPLVFLLATIAFGVIGHLPLIPIEIAVSGTPTIGLESLLALLYFAIFPSLLAYIFWNRAVKSLGPARAAPFMYLMPLFAAALAIVFLGERLGTYHVIGMAIIVAGLTTALRAPARADARR